MMAAARAVARRPELWWSALGALRRMAAPGWWKDGPYLPLPDQRLWGFRMVTAYGRPDAVPEPADVISYLEWCRSTGASHWMKGMRRVPPVAAGHLDPTRPG
jgi:hypothetical protein